MTWPFDPWNLRPSVRADEPAPAWPDLWAEATKWWTDPATRATEALTEGNERLLAELTEGVVRRFEGRHVSLSIAGGLVRALVDWIRVRGDERHDARLELRDVAWNGWAFETLSVQAGSVRVEARPSPRLVVSAVRLEGRTPLDDLLTWLEPRIPRWGLGLDAADRVVGRRPDLSLALAVEPVVLDGRVQLELRALRWRRVAVEVPAWLRLTRTVELPDLPQGLRIVEARRAGAAVEFRATVPSAQAPIDLGRLRDAIVDAAPPFV